MQLDCFCSLLVARFPIYSSCSNDFIKRSLLLPLIQTHTIKKEFCAQSCGRQFVEGQTALADFGGLYWCLVSFTQVILTAYNSMEW